MPASFRSLLIISARGILATADACLRDVTRAIVFLKMGKFIQQCTDLRFMADLKMGF
jgi:hypothetical protein